jgi:hypothetical protein
MSNYFKNTKKFAFITVYDARRKPTFEQPKTVA